MTLDLIWFIISNTYNLIISYQIWSYHVYSAHLRSNLMSCLIWSNPIAPDHIIWKMTISLPTWSNHIILILHPANHQTTPICITPNLTKSPLTWLYDRKFDRITYSLIMYLFWINSYHIWSSNYSINIISNLIILHLNWSNPI